MVEEEEHCDLVIALTHMRLNNDRKVLKNTTTIDLFLGGHDHVKIIKNLLKALELFRKCILDSYNLLQNKSYNSHRLT